MVGGVEKGVREKSERREGRVERGNEKEEGERSAGGLIFNVINEL